MSMPSMTGTLFSLLKYSRARKDPPIAAAWFRLLYLEYLLKTLSVLIVITVTKTAEITSFMFIYWKKKLYNPRGYEIFTFLHENSFQIRTFKLRDAVGQQEDVAGYVAFRGFFLDLDADLALFFLRHFFPVTKEVLIARCPEVDDQPELAAEVERRLCDTPISEQPFNFQKEFVLRNTVVVNSAGHSIGGNFYAFDVRIFKVLSAFAVRSEQAHDGFQTLTRGIHVNISDGVSGLPSFSPVRHYVFERQRVISTVKFDDLVGESLVFYHLVLQPKIFYLVSADSICCLTFFCGLCDQDFVVRSKTHLEFKLLSYGARSEQTAVLENLSELDLNGTSEDFK